MKIFIPLLIFVMIFVSGCSIKECGTDLNCFKELAKDCSRGKVNIIHEDNNIRLTSRGTLFGKCKLSLKIEEIGEKLRQENPTMAILAKGKTLNCAIPVEIVEYNPNQYINEILNFEEQFDQYCSGPIKDVLQGPLKEVIKDKVKITIN